MADRRASKPGQRIVVAGDVAVDWLQWVVTYKEQSGADGLPNWAMYPGTRMKAEAGGAVLLAKLISSATGNGVITHRLADVERIPPEKVLRSTATLDAYPASARDRDHKVYRVRQYGGFVGPADGRLEPLPLADDDPDAAIVVLADSGNGFRDCPGVWPRAITESGKHPLVILSMGRPPGTGALWKRLQEAHSASLVVIVNADDLREMGVSISRGLSWEQTAEDFRWQIANNPAIQSLAACRHLIVRFGLDGAIYYRGNGKTSDAKLFYDPGLAEGGFREQHGGDMQGTRVAFVAALSCEIARDGLAEIAKGIHAGIQKSRQFFADGFGEPGSEPAYQTDKVFGLAGRSIGPVSEAMIPPMADESDGRRSRWTILDDCIRGKMESIAFSAVRKKEEVSLKDVPAARFGGLFTLDRGEIEGLRSIKNLIMEYLGRKDTTVPLSIAVFGPPGSGKSFGVTQLSMSLDPRIEKIEFNVAQFTTVDDLVHAFHRVRDMVLAGKIPLVFFDEFDAGFGGEMGWLKYFLAPMQDGAFKEGETMHPIGKSIFVFAGGTSHSFRQFSREYPGDHLSAVEREQIAGRFRDAKGTDFISRLRGYVDVMGPNRNGSDDAFFMIRRALLLRSIIRRKAPHLLDEHEGIGIDNGVLRAFLKVPAYKHGARSMEAIVDMSMLAGRKKFEQAALPSPRQLDLHVDPDIFSKLMLRDVLFQNAMERLAMESHAMDVKDLAGNRRKSDPAMRSWEKLPESFRESSRNRSRQIPEKLQQIGLDFMPMAETAVTADASRMAEMPARQFAFTDAQVEALAEMEHERWMAERLRDGWTPGEKRDLKRKISPYLVPYAELPEDIKDRDRHPVRRIPELLAKAGFEVYRLQ